MYIAIAIHTYTCIHIYTLYNLTNLCCLLSDNGQPEGVELLLPSSRRSELLRNIVGTASALSHFSAGTPKSLRYRTSSVQNSLP